MDKDIGQRIRDLRKSKKLNQVDFGKVLDMTGAAISTLELGKASVTKKNAKVICEKFRVSEKWLLEGEGEMIDFDSPRTRDEQLLVEIYRQLTPEMQDIILEHIKRLSVNELRKKKGEIG